MSTIPQWRFPDDLEATCKKYQNKRKPFNPRPKYSIDDIREAAFRYDRSIKRDLAYHRVLIPALFYNAQLEVKKISEIMGMNHPEAYVQRFKPFVLDPNYNPKHIQVNRSHPELLGLTVIEAAKALHCSDRHLYNYIHKYSTIGPNLKIMFDEIFLHDNPPLPLVKAANEKRLKEQERAYNKQAKFLIGD